MRLPDLVPHPNLLKGFRSNARNELWFVLELAKTLATSTGFPSNPPATADMSQPGRKPKPKPAPKAPIEAPSVPASADAPIFPAGTMSTTPFTSQSRSQLQTIHDMELTLAAKQNAIDQCEEMLDTAIEEFVKQAAASAKFWRDIKQLRDGVSGRGQWAIIPKPDFDKALPTGADARDLVIPYAIDEGKRSPVHQLVHLHLVAWTSIRSRSLAAFDLDPSKKAALTFGARARRQMRVVYNNASGLASVSSLLPAEDTSNLMQEIQNAQIETFDEDLWGEVRCCGSL